MGTKSKDKHGEVASLPGSGLPQIVFSISPAMSFSLLSSLLTEIERTADDPVAAAAAADTVVWDIVNRSKNPRKAKVSGLSRDCSGGQVLVKKDNCEGKVSLASEAVGNAGTFSLNFRAAKDQKVALCCTKNGNTSELSTWNVP